MDDLKATYQKLSDRASAKRYLYFSAICALFGIIILSLLWSFAVSSSASKPTSIEGHNLTAEDLPL